jgi:hypothetical protein
VERALEVKGVHAELTRQIQATRGGQCAVEGDGDEPGALQGEKESEPIGAVWQAKRDALAGPAAVEEDGEFKRPLREGVGGPGNVAVRLDEDDAARAVLMREQPLFPKEAFVSRARHAGRT